MLGNHSNSCLNLIRLTVASPIAQFVKNLPVMQETPVQFLGREDPLVRGQAAHPSILGLPLWLSWQRICLQCRRPVSNPWVGKIPWRRERLSIPVFWPGESMVYSPGGRKESDMTERLSLSLTAQFKYLITLLLVG